MGGTATGAVDGRTRSMARLGELERAVMNVLWEAGEPITARRIADALPDRDLAQTTVLTVLSRLEGKRMVTRSRDGRAHTYEPVASRADHVAGLMHEVLGTAGDRAAALARFAGQVSAEDAAALQAALADAERLRGPGRGHGRGRPRGDTPGAADTQRGGLRGDESAPTAPPAERPSGDTRHTDRTRDGGAQP